MDLLGDIRPNLSLHGYGNDLMHMHVLFRPKSPLEDWFWARRRIVLTQAKILLFTIE